MLWWLGGWSWTSIEDSPFSFAGSHAVRAFRGRSTLYSALLVYDKRVCETLLSLWKVKVAVLRIRVKMKSDLCCALLLSRWAKSVESSSTSGVNLGIPTRRSITSRPVSRLFEYSSQSRLIDHRRVPRFTGLEYDPSRDFTIWTVHEWMSDGMRGCRVGWAGQS